MAITRVSNSSVLNNTPKKRSMLVGQDPLILSYDSIATYVVDASGATSITFSSIPATYSHLELRIFARETAAVTYTDMRVRINGDTAANYSIHLINGDRSAGSTANTINSTFTYSIKVPGASSAASSFGSAIVSIPDYTSTNKAKTIRSLGGYDTNGTGNVGIVSALWFATPAAINSIQFYTGSTGFVQYSSFALYGIK